MQNIVSEISICNGIFDILVHLLYKCSESQKKTRFVQIISNLDKFQSKTITIFKKDTRLLQKHEKGTYL